MADRPLSSRYIHHRIPTSSVPIHVVEVTGAERPMVMLHGIGMDWRVWQAVSRRLGASFAPFLVDLRGHGESGKPKRGYSLADYAADVEDVLDALDLTGAVLVGSSLGGMVAACVEAPLDLVSHVVLVDPPLTGGPTRDVAMLSAILELKHRPPEQLTSYLAALNPGSSPLLMRTMSEMWREAADGVIEEPLQERHSYFAIDGALAGLAAPTLLLQADPARGGVLTDAQAQRALSLLPHGELTRVSGAGHAIHGDMPDRFADLVSAFASR